MIIAALLVAGCTSSGDDEHVTEQRAFGRYASTFQNHADCQAAKDAGAFPSLAACQDQIMLCPDGRAATLISGDVIERPTYKVEGDRLTLMFSSDSELVGSLNADGTLVTDDRGRPWESITIVDGIGWELSQCDQPWSP